MEMFVGIDANGEMITRALTPEEDAKLTAAINYKG